MSIESVLVNYNQWLNFKKRVRAFFDSQGLQEVETPTLVFGPAFEAFLEPFTTQGNWEGRTYELSLPTSPEIHLKKLLMMGFSNIYEIKSCFRNGECGPNHEPEFTMLEWYRNSTNLNLLQEDIAQLFIFLHEEGLLFGELPNIRHISMAQLFSESLGFVLTPETPNDQLLHLAHTRGLNPSGEESRNVLVDWLFVSEIEPLLNPQEITVISNYPPWTVTLAAINESGWAQRFEVYFGGLELANAFGELTSHSEHMKRWEHIQTSRIQMNRTPLPKDESFFTQLAQRGLPPSVGIALGLERLFMATHKINRISDFKPFAKYQG